MDYSVIYASNFNRIQVTRYASFRLQNRDGSSGIRIRLCIQRSSRKINLILMRCELKYINQAYSDFQSRYKLLNYHQL